MSPQVHSEIRAVRHLPAVRFYADLLGIPQVIEAICPKHDQSRVSDAECVMAMIYNILDGRVALYAMDTWCANADVELLIGEGCEPDAFNDTRLAVALDHIDEAGTDAIMAGVIERYLQWDDRPTEYSVHTDTTSVSLYGEYLGDAEPNVTYGHSKDKRPDRGQVIFGLSVHGMLGIPLTVQIAAGNTSDTTANRDVLTRLSGLLPDTDQVTVVADCKAVDAITIGRVLDEGLHVISLVPRSYKLRGEMIDAAWEACPELSEWPELQRKPGRRKADPHKVYSGWSITMPFEVKRQRERADGEGTELYETTVPMRMLVVHSTTLAAKFERSLERKLNKERASLDKFVKKHQRNDEGFFCEADARKAAEKLLVQTRLLSVETFTESKEVPVKRARAGRPKAGEKTPTKTVWTVRFSSQPDEEAISQARRRASCFMLITDHTDDQSWSDARILGEYRRQYLVENHTGFRWLKSEAAVSPMFVKTPRRIRALGLVMVLALMVRNFIQYTLRRELRRRDETLPHPFTKKQVNNLTFEMATKWFWGIQGLKISIDGSPLQRLAPVLAAPAERILELLGIPKSCFCIPPPRMSPYHASIEALSAA